MHRITSYAGVNFSALGFRAAAPFGVPAPERNPVALGRLDADALLGGIERGLRTIPVEVKLDLGASGVTPAQARTRFTDLLGRLNPDDPTPRPLTGQLDLDSDGVPETTVEIAASLIDWAWRGDADVILVLRFASPSSTWRAPTYTDPGVFTVSSSPTALTFTNGGKARAYPLIRLCQATGGQRSGGNSTVGWKYRRIQRVTNNTTRHWTGLEPIFLDLGDTAALVSAGKALASGDDLRVVLHGRMLARTLMGWNTRRTFCVVHPEVPAGASVDLEIVYGNPGAGPPKTLTNERLVDGDYSAVDLTSDSGSSSGSTGTTLNDPTKNWPTNYWTGAFVQMTSGVIAGRARRVISNTATTLTVRNWSTAPADGDSYVIWRSGWVADGGGVSSATATTLTDSAQSWGADEYKGGTVRILSGTGAGQVRTITANTATTLTVTPAWTTTPDTTSRFQIDRYGYLAYAVGAQPFDDGSLSVKARGCWQINRFYSKPTEVAFGDFCVGGWMRDTFPVGGNDDFTQFSYVNRGAVGSKSRFFTTGLDARLRRNSARTYSEEGLGNATTFISQLGITGLRFSYEIKNTNSAAGATTGIGKFLIATRADGDLEWETVYEDTTLRTSFTTVATQYLNLRNADGNPTMLIAAAIPADEVEVSTSAAANDELAVRWSSRLEVQLDPTSITLDPLSAEEEVYQLAATLRTGLVSTPGHQRLILGGDGHHIFLGPATGEVIEIDCQVGTIRLYDGGPLSLGGGLIYNREAPWAARILHYPDDPDNDGVLDPRVSPAWMPVEIGDNTWYLEEPLIGTIEVQILWQDSYYG